MGPDAVEAVTARESSRAAATPAAASVSVPIHPGAAGPFDYTLGWLLDGIAAYLA